METCTRKNLSLVASLLLALAMASPMNAQIDDLIAAVIARTNAVYFFPTLDQPVPVIQDSACRWYPICPPLTPTRSGPGYGQYQSLLGLADGEYFAKTEASGMEIWAEAEAWDAVLGSAASAATSSISTGKVTLYLIPGCSAPNPRMTIDWKPKFKLRAQIVSPNCAVSVAGAMKGDCEELAVKVAAAGAIERANGASQSGSTFTVLGLTVPVGFATGTGITEMPYLDLKHNYKDIAMATCTFEGTVAISVNANDSGGLRAECKAACFESKAGLDLDGVCLNCGAHGYIVYGWY